jgi:hypothetical protein
LSIRPKNKMALEVEIVQPKEKGGRGKKK